jgi:plasmid replication initiation protein
MVSEHQRVISSERATLDRLRRSPILSKTGDTQVQVYAVPEHRMATIWDADVLIWASQMLAAQDRGLPTSRTGP